MKRLLITLGCTLLSATLSFSTPDRVVDIEEDFLGSNVEGFAILRTEYDNMGSYYASQVKRYLDEYVKLPKEPGYSLAIANRVKSTLILDTASTHDPDGKSSEETHAEDGSISLAAILKKYPARAVKWDSARFAKLTVSQGSGVYAGNLGIVSNYEVATEVFGFKSDQIEWTLEEVRSDMNCVYFRFTTGTEDEDSQSRWVCNVPRKSQQIDDHLSLEPFYLAAGSYKTAKEALERARSISKKAKEAKQYPPELEVWSVSQDSDVPLFTIVLRNSMNDIQPEKFERLKLLVGPDLVPTSSKRFQERTQLDEPP